MKFSAESVALLFLSLEFKTQGVEFLNDFFQRFFTEVTNFDHILLGAADQIFKLGARRGDAAEMAIVKLIKEAAPVVEAPAEEKKAPKKRAKKEEAVEA